MRKFSFRIVLFAVITFVIWSFLHPLMDRVYKLQVNRNLYHNDNLITQGYIPDIAVMGSSRAYRHIDTDYIKKETGLEVHNYGISDGRLDLQRTQWSHLNKGEKSPKVIIQNVDMHTMTRTEGTYDKLQFLPFIRDGYVSDALSEFDKAVLLESNIPMIAYRGTVNKVWKAAFTDPTFKKRSETLYPTGFQDSEQYWNPKHPPVAPDAIDMRSKPFKLEAENIAYSKKLIEDQIRTAQQHNQILIYVWTPMFTNWKIKYQEEYAYYTQYFDSISMGTDRVFYYDFAEIAEIKSDTAYFYNNSHLNRDGAYLFTRKFYDTIKPILKAENLIRGK